MKPFRLLVTKKLGQSVIEQTPLEDVVILEKEFIRIIPISTAEIKQKIRSIAEKENAIIFTSKNAVLAVASAANSINSNSKIFCLDGVTKEYVVKYFGEEKIAVVAHNAEALAIEIAAHNTHGALYFFCGKKRRDELPASLLKKGIIPEQVIVYETKLSPEKITDPFDGICFFSPSAAESFFSMNQLNNNTVCFSIGDTTTNALTELTGNKIYTSEKASEKSMLYLVNNYLKKHNE